MIKQRIKCNDVETELLLMQEIANGNKTAWETLYRQYFEILRRHAIAKTRNPMESDDIAQEVLIRLWLKRERLPQVTYPYQYLITAVNHMIYNYFRHLGIVRKYERNADVEYTDETLESEVHRKSIEAAIDGEINRLPVRCRTAFNLSRQCHMSNREIAKEMQISRRTVENYITTALRRLRLLMNIVPQGIATISLDAEITFDIRHSPEPDEVSVLIIREAC